MLRRQTGRTGGALKSLTDPKPSVLLLFTDSHIPYLNELVTSELNYLSAMARFIRKICAACLRLFNHVLKKVVTRSRNQGPGPDSRIVDTKDDDREWHGVPGK